MTNKILKNILSGEELDDLSIEAFHGLLKPKYRPRPTIFVQKPNNILSWEKYLTQPHLQILWSKCQHWVCMYYNGLNTIFIFDSTNTVEHYNKELLNSAIVLFLRHLFPNSLNNMQLVVPAIKYPQTNNTDCGVYACAYATSIFMGNTNVQNERYNMKLARKFLYHTICRQHIYREFPKIINTF